jgi:hypothetical protein
VVEQSWTTAGRLADSVAAAVLGVVSVGVACASADGSGVVSNCSSHLDELAQGDGRGRQLEEVVELRRAVTMGWFIYRWFVPQLTDIIFSTNLTSPQTYLMTRLRHKLPLLYSVLSFSEFSYGIPSMFLCSISGICSVARPEDHFRCNPEKLFLLSYVVVVIINATNITETRGSHHGSRSDFFCAFLFRWGATRRTSVDMDP